VEMAEQKAKRAEEKLYEMISGTIIDRNKVTGEYDATTCEGKISHISCPGETFINVSSADYGRHSSSVCSQHGYFHTVCSSKKAIEIVQKK